MKQCPKCETQNENSARFCGSCNSSLEMVFGTSERPEVSSSFERVLPEKPALPLEQEATAPELDTVKSEWGSFSPKPQSDTAEQIQADTHDHEPEQQEISPQILAQTTTTEIYRQTSTSEQQHLGFARTHEERTKMGGLLILIAVGSIIWVIFDFVITVLMIIGSALTIPTAGDIALYYGNPTIGYPIILLSEITRLLAIVFTVLFISKMFKRGASFLRNAQICMFINMFCVILLLIGFGISSGMFHFSDEILIMIVIIGFIVAFLFAILLLFTLYMCRSKRVREYMGSDEYIKKAIIRFKNRH